MAAVPRSQTLIQSTTSAAGFSPIWVTPADHVTLVKTMFVYNTSANSADTSLQIARAGGTNAVILWRMVLNSGEFENWSGWAVLNPGDLCRVYTTQGGVVVWVCGAVLLGAPLFPPASFLRSDFATSLPA